MTGDEAAPKGRSEKSLVACAGLIVADLFVPPLDALPESGELITTGDLLTDVGGCAANTATALVHMGVPTVLSAKVGRDGQGDWVRSNLISKGVDVSGMTSSSTLATSQTVILPVVGDDRRYIHAVGANAELTADEIGQVSAGVEVLAVGGFLALPAVHAVDLAKLFSNARAAGTRTVLDVVIPHGATDIAQRIKSVMAFVDCFLPNQDEAHDLTGESDPAMQAQILLGWGCSSVVITCGAEGAVYADADEVVKVLPLPVEFVDGSGAGDAFAAGIILGFLEDWPLENRLRFAAAVGASVTRGLGCTSTLFSRDEALAAADSVRVVRGLAAR